MKVVMLIDLAITVGAVALGAMYWAKANQAWKLAIAAAFVLLFGSISKNLATYDVISNPGWGVMIGDIPIIQVLYVCGSEFLLLLAIWKASQNQDAG